MYHNRKTTNAICLRAGLIMGFFALALTALSQGFVTTWQTINNNESITIPTAPGETYSYTVDWGDGSSNSNVSGDISHVYALAGIHTVTITGTFPHIYFNSGSGGQDIDKILTVEQWGSISWSSFSRAFSGCSNLTLNAIDAPDLTNVTSLASMFSSCTSLNHSIDHWDVSTITSMSYMFAGASAFNQSLNGWNVSGVTNMGGMFYYADAFNGDISDWNVANVVNMREMFVGNLAFNQDISGWNVGNVKSMAQMFLGASSFNQPIGSWDVSQVIDFGTSLATDNGMLGGASAFDQDLSAWDISSATDMEFIFQNSGMSTRNYDATLSGWARLDPSESQIPSGISLGASGLTFCNASADRQDLIDNFSWTFSGDSESCQPFITTWQTTVANESITIPTIDAGYDYSVDWGDGASESGLIGDASHIYASAGTYTVTISGDFPRIYFNNGQEGQHKDKIMSIEQWGDIQWSSMEHSFYGCSNLGYNAVDAPNLGSVTKMDRMFSQTSIGGPDLSGWDVSNVTSFFDVFFGSNFDGSVAAWDMSSAITLQGMFGFTPFDGSLDSWDVSNVWNMDYVFWGAPNFNQPLDSWDVSGVETFTTMLGGASSFDQSLAAWDISSASNMDGMLDNVAMSAVNYDATLVGWSTLEMGESQIPTNITLGAANVSYCGGYASREDLINTHTWVISDGGFDNSCAFITTWETTAASESITIPTTGGGFNYVVDWGDGTFETGFTGDATHTYADPGIHTVSIAGDFPQIFFNRGSQGQHKDKILTVEQWGNIVWSSFSNAFSGCSNFTVNASDAPNLSNVTSLFAAFASCTVFDGNIDHWDVSTIENMNGLFSSARAFNQPLNSWNVSNVKQMGGMFYSARSFNQPIGSWNVGEVTNMREMFAWCVEFDQDISEWNVGKVTDMAQMFHFASSFNQPIGGWDVSKVTDFGTSVISDNGMLGGASSFDQNLADWDISSAVDMEHILANTAMSTSNYDATLIGWATLDAGESQIPTGIDISASPTFCNGFLARADLISNYSWTITDGGFASDCAFITTWQTTTTNESITIPTEGSGYNYEVDWGDGSNDDGLTGNAQHTFVEPGTYTVSIRGDFPRIFFDNVGDKDKILTVEQWGLVQWEDMTRAFSGCSNLSIVATDAPDLSLVTSLEGMFSLATSINADINDWDVSTITSMFAMFEDATSFNQDISGWDVSNVEFFERMFQGAASFNQPLDAWDISSARTMDAMLGYTPMTPTNYQTTLEGWLSLDPGEEGIPESILLGAYGLTYCEAAPVRQQLINEYGWSFSGDNLDCVDGPVAFFEFSGNTEDVTGNGYHATNNGATLTTDRFGNANNAYAFDGTANYMMSDLVLQDNQPFSISVWVEWDGGNGEFQEIVSWLEGDNGRTYMGISPGSDEIRFGDTYTASGVFLPAGYWHHVAAVYDGSEALIYLNGKHVATSDPNRNYIFANGTLHIGRQGEIAAEYWDGKIDDLKIFDRDLSAEEIYEEFSIGGWSEFNSGLVGYYPLDGDTEDASGFGNDATENGSLSTTADRFGNPDGAYLFDGSTAYLTVPYAESLNLVDEMTLSAWIKVTANEPNNQAIIAKGEAGNFDYLLNVLDNGAPETGSSSFDYLAGSQNLHDDSWHQVIGRYDGQSLEIYVDGILNGSGAFSGEINQTPQKLFIGAHETVGPSIIRYLNGALDDVRIYNRALTFDEIRALYFTEAGKPIISSVIPSQGAVGSLVTLSGANFGAEAVDNIVYFGGVRADVVQASQSALTVQVPFGATYSEVSVTVNGLRGSSQERFVVTFDNDDVDFGAFESYGVLDTGLEPRGVELGDLDGDGRLDIAAVAAGSDVVHLFRNTQTIPAEIAFDDPVNLATGSGPWGLALEDLDNDGLLEVITPNGNSGTVSIFKNNSTPGNFNFQSKFDMSVGSQPLSVATGDVDGDGRVDLIVSNNGDHDISILRNASEPGSLAFEGAFDLAANDIPFAAVVADLDGDGLPEILTQSASTGLLSIFPNESWSIGDLSFGTRIDLATASVPTNVEVGDLDGDGRLDVLVACESGSVSIFKNSSAAVGDFSFESRQDYAVFTNTVGIAVSDLDGDGMLDLITAGELADNLLIQRNTASGLGEITFGDGSTLATSLNPYWVASGDLDNDGRTDLISSNFHGESISVFRNRAGSTFYDDLLAYYPFNGNAEDQSGYAFHGTIDGAELRPDRFGVEGASYDFDATDDFVEVPSTDFFGGADQVTISWWVNTRSSTVFQDMISLGNIRSYVRDDGNMAMDMFIGSSSIPLFSSIATDQWEHFVFTYDGGTSRLFRNGELVDQLGRSGPVDEFVGSAYFGILGGASNPMDGSLDDIRLYSRALETWEVRSLFSQNGWTATNTDRLLYYAFDGNADDLSGNQHDGTVVGALLTDDRLGNAQSAYSLDGVNDRIVHEDVTKAGNLTVAAWFRTVADLGGVGYVNIIDIQGALGLGLGGTNELDGILRIQSGDFISVNSGIAVNDGEWHHAAMSYDGVSIRLYLDGTQVGVTADLDGDVYYEEPVVDFNVGYSFDGLSRWFQGDVDEVQYFRRALSAEEILGLYGADTDFKSFEVAAANGPATIDVGNHTVTVQVANGTDLHSLAVTFELADGAWAALDEELFESGESGDFSFSRTITVFGANGVDEQPWTISITEEFPNDINFESITEALPSLQMGFNVGVSWGDINGDGFPDLHLNQWNFDTDEIGRTYYNDQSGGFVDVSDLRADVALGATALVDFDNDGDLDIVPSFDGTGDWGDTNWKTVQVNNGDGTFTKRILMVPAGPTTYLAWNSGWADFDNDGDLDVLHLQENGDGLNKFFVNDGDGTFTENTTSIIATDAGESLDVRWVDMDNDGDLDLLVTNNEGPNGLADDLFFNDGDGTFTKNTTDPIVLDPNPSDTQSWADIDNDGDMDVFIGTSEAPFGDKMYRNNGDGTFTALSNGITAVANTQTIGSAFSDYDNDGDQDLFLSNGGVKIWQNDGSGNFTEVTGTLVNRISNSWGIAFADYDQDGFEDLLVPNWLQRSNLYRNTGTSNNFLNVELVGLRSNAPGIGARVVVSADINGLGLVHQTQQVMSNSGIRAQSDYQLHFGLGTASTATITIYWPSGIEQVVEDVTANQFVVITEDLGSNEKEILNVSIDGQLSVNIDAEAFLVEVEMPFGTNVTALSPAIEISPEATISPASGEPQDFSSPVTYTVTAEDWTTQEWEMAVILVTDLPDVERGDLEWADYDNDGDLDLLIMGLTDAGEIVELYENIGSGDFAPAFSFDGLYDGDAAFADYDNDGDLDLMLTGWNDLEGQVSSLYRNDGNSFTEVFPGTFQPVEFSSIAWADFDNNGTEDLILTGSTGAGVFSILYENSISAFTPVQQGTLQGVDFSSVAWSDYDVDGDLDLMLTGEDVDINLHSILYTNDDGILSEEIAASFTGVSEGSIAWSDYDSDGYPDLLITGNSALGVVAEMYDNTSSGFELAQLVSFPSSFGGVRHGAIGFGDTDNDGDPDLTITGLTDNGPVPMARLFENTGSDFAEQAVFEGVNFSSVALADYDNDADVDIAIAGNTGVEKRTDLYANPEASTNFGPNAPTDLEVEVRKNTQIFSWSAPTDDTTPTEALTYDLYLYDITNDVFIDAVTADINSGFRTLSKTGTIQGTEWTINHLMDPGLYEWGVQAVDAGMKGGAFASQVFEVASDEILYFHIDGQVGTSILDYDAKTVSIEMPEGTDLTSLTPDIEIPNGSDISPLSGVTQDFSSPVAYFVSDGVDTREWMVTVSDTGPGSNIVSFEVDGQVGSSTIDLETLVVDFVMPFGTNLSSLSPTITVSDGAAISPDSGEAQDFSSPVVYTVTSSINREKDWTVTATVAANDENDILTFEIPGQGQITVDPVDHTVTVEMPFGTDLSNLTPVITFSQQATILPASGEAQDFTDPVIYTVTSGQAVGQQWTVTVKVAPNDENDILTFDIPGQVEATINDVDHTVSVVMPYGTDLTSLTPTITVSPQATVSPLSGVAQDFSSPVVYTVTSGEAVAQDWTVSVTALPNDENDIVAFEIPGQIQSSIDEVSHRVSVVMPFGTDVTSLTPNITVSPQATISPLSGESQDFSGEVTYTVTSGLSVPQDWTVGVVVESGDGNDIFTFEISDQVQSTVDDASHEVTVVMPFGTDVASLTPTITISPEATISPASGVPQDFSSPVTYEVTSGQSVPQVWTVSVIIESGDGNDIFTFGIPGQTQSAVDAGSHTVLVVMPFGTDLSNLTPEITFSPQASISPANGEAQDFSEPVIYTVTSGQNVAQEWTVTVTLAPNDETDILVFEIPDQVQSTVESADHTVSVVMPAATDLSSLTPTIMLSPQATIDPASGVAQNFTNTVAYTVTAGNGDQQVWTVSVNVEDEPATNSAPTAIFLSNSKILANAGGSQVVGVLTTQDVDNGDSFTYSITGGEDAGQFSVNGNSLRTESDLGPGNYQLDIESRDAAGATVRESFSITAIAQNTTGVVGVGTQVSSYRIIAIPRNSTSVSEVFTELNSAGQGSEWRLLSFSGGSYRDLTFSGSISGGRGYWFLSSAGTSMTIPPGDPVSVNSDLYYEMSLSQGWNLIGNPFLDDISWNQVVAENIDLGQISDGDLLNNGVFTFNGSYNISNSLSVYRGGWVFANSSLRLLVRNPSSDLGGRMAQENRSLQESWYIAPDDWQLLLKVSDGSLESNLSGIGMNPQALASIDRFDMPFPPEVDVTAQMRLESSDGLARSFVSPTEGFTWEFTPKTASEEGLLISWDERMIRSLPEDIYLVVKGSRTIVNMKQQSSIHLKSGEGISIVYGQDERLNGLPLSVQVFPNPSQGRASFRIFVLGTESTYNGNVVIYSVNGSKLFEMPLTVIQGISNDVVIDPLPLDAGLYLYQVDFGDRKTDLKKLTVIK